MGTFSADVVHEPNTVKSTCKAAKKVNNFKCMAVRVRDKKIDTL